MSRPLLTNSYTASADIAGNRIVKYGAASATAAIAGAGEAAFGISDRVGVKAGEICDVHEVGEADVTYGGAIAKNDPLTSDAQGRAVKATPAAGVNVEIIAFARWPGVLGDVRPVTITRTRIQG